MTNLRVLRPSVVQREQDEELLRSQSSPHQSSKNLSSLLSARQSVQLSNVLSTESVFWLHCATAEHWSDLIGKDAVTLQGLTL